MDLLKKENEIDPLNIPLSISSLKTTSSIDPSNIPLPISSSSSINDELEKLNKELDDVLNSTEELLKNLENDSNLIKTILDI
jgi:hypothetical protein